MGLCTFHYWYWSTLSKQALKLSRNYKDILSYSFVYAKICTERTGSRSFGRINVSIGLRYNAYVKRAR